MKTPPLRQMRRASPLALATSLALNLGLPHAAHAATDAELKQLKQEMQQEIRQMREQYEARLKTLEQKLQEASPISQPISPPPDNSAPASNGFNPAVSLILSGNYAHLSKDPSTWRLGGFPVGDGEIGPGSKGLNLGESEINFAANIDPWWYGALTLAFSADNTVAVEEAFVQNSSLANGLKVKAGRFFSGLGYLNEQHAHTWDFVDAPLAYQAFLGGQLGQDGVQAKWLAPTDAFMELGLEAARGDATDNGAGRTALFAHTGGDVGDSNSWRLGLSQLWERSLSRSFTATNLQTGLDANNTFTGHDRVAVLDGVWKWAPNGNGTRTNVKLQGEYFRRQAQGQLLAELEDTYTSTQSGWYLQGIYQFMPGWRVGVRHDQLNLGKTDLASNTGLIELPSHNPRRNSVMLDWSLSEFSRWRVQLNSDQTRPGAADTQLYLQYQMSLGAHGAHSY